MTPLWLALRLPRLCIEARAPLPSPSAIVERGRVVIGDEAAQDAGVTPGIGAAAARALSPGILLLARDRAREDAAMRALACWAGCLTPRVSVLADTLLLELGACLRLFGGLEKLQAAALAGVAAQGFRAACAAASTPLGAEWLARLSPGACCKDAGDLRRGLDDLPVSLLPADAAAALARFGARTLGEARRLPSAALARRIGEASLRLLERAYGERPDPRPDFVFPERFALPLQLPSAVDNAAALLFAARRLSAALAGWLAARQAGVREAVLCLRHRRDETRVVLRFAGLTAEGGRLERVLRERLERLTLAAPVEALRLEAARVEALPGRSRPLLDDAQSGQEALDILLERLGARLGEERVYRVAAHADYRPECATRRLRPLGKYAPDAPCRSSIPPPRPLWLLDAPEALPEVDGRPYRRGPLTLLAGPERIESGWWDGGEQAGDARRDYFVALAKDAAWLWIYRECQARGWFLHGFFS
ncbi:MAG: DNA polymerase Y family protein [Candidatus Accumulibacter sp.]|jgi:protein ImuB|nr:DNA polymerase Y family protein [Accumulibacter sp.]